MECSLGLGSQQKGGHTAAQPSPHLMRGPERSRQVQVPRGSGLSEDTVVSYTGVLGTNILKAVGATCCDLPSVAASV